ncbi:MAG: hypothetical protein QOK05_2994 [Chloroflexota bacterium]|nr:hypothetical protein [Chloroflexota bacterium]
MGPPVDSTTVNSQAVNFGDWQCPVCGGTEAAPAFRRNTGGLRPTADNFKPSAEHFGSTASEVLRCTACGHGSLATMPADTMVMEAYEDAADPVSLREEPGQVATAERALADIERFATPGPMVDLGCWTGSFMVAARNRGWDAVGIEPSDWARARAVERGLDARKADLFAHGLPEKSFSLVVLCDVLEHLADPRAGLGVIAGLLKPGGALYLTIPNAGSPLARALGRRWWSVLPMHLQYFTPASLRMALESSGFSVRSSRSHAKAFTARYYAERLGGYSPQLARGVVGLVNAVGMSNRMVAPNFGDRLAVIATLES